MKNDFLDIIREKAIYIKFTSDIKAGGGVFIDDMLNVLDSIKQSYKNYIEIEYSKSSKNPISKKIKSAYDKLNDDNKLMLVDLDFASCNVGLAPNLVTSNNEVQLIKNSKKWKEEKFDDYINTFFRDKFDAELFSKVGDRYNAEERKKIYQPLYNGIINNHSISLRYSIGSKIYDKKFSKVNEKYLSFMLYDTQKEDKKIINDNFVKRFAVVEVSESTNMPVMNKNKVTLFDDPINPTIIFKEIVVDQYTYKLKMPLPFNYIKEMDKVSLENETIGIFVSGSNLKEATEEVGRDFDYIYKRYNELPNEKLSEKVIFIKNLLNTIVI